MEVYNWFSASAAATGKVSSVITRIIEGALNLSYKGNVLNKNVLKPGKYLPQDIMMANIEITNKPQRIGCLMTIKPIIARIKIIAPI
ncbi:MAG: hypothetical protein WDO19_33405 [Bacteroidota bacterium]